MLRFLQETFPFSLVVEKESIVIPKVNQVYFANHFGMRGALEKSLVFTAIKCRAET